VLGQRSKEWFQQSREDRGPVSIYNERPRESEYRLSTGFPQMKVRILQPSQDNLKHALQERYDTVSM